jgi:hypothetical protein
MIREGGEQQISAAYESKKYMLKNEIAWKIVNFFHNSPALSWLSCPSCPFLAVPSTLSCPGGSVLTVLLWPVPGVLSLQSGFGCLVLAVVFWQLCPGNPILAFLSWHPHPGCRVLAAFCWLSCSSSPVLVVLFWQSFAGCPVLAVLS